MAEEEGWGRETDETGGWWRGAEVIGLWEDSYLSRANVLPGPFRRLAELLSNQRREQMQTISRRSRISASRGRPSVRNRLKTAHAKKPIQLPVYQWLSEGEVWRSNRLGRERWGDNELSREIRAIEWAPGRQMFKHAFAYRPQHQCDGVSPSKESWEQEDLFSVGVSSSASQDQKLEHSEMRQVLYIQND